MTIIKIIDVNGNERECDSITVDLHFPGYLKVAYLSKRHPDRRLMDWYKIEDFKRLNPQLVHLAATETKLSEDILGVVTEASETTIKDKKQKWKANMYKGFNVWISRGKGEGQVRKVVKNTKTVLTIDVPWDEIPDITSQYVVSLTDYYPPANSNTLPFVEEPTKKKI